MFARQPTIIVVVFIQKQFPRLFRKTTMIVNALHLLCAPLAEARLYDCWIEEPLAPPMRKITHNNAIGENMEADIFVGLWNCVKPILYLRGR